MQRTLDLVYDELIIGADLSALCYSYVNSVPIIFLRHLKPYKKIYESHYDDDIDNNNLDLWNKLMFHISFNNLSPFADNVQSIRIIDNNNLKIVTNQSFIVNIKFNKLIVSDDYKLSGLPTVCGMTDTKNLVVDYFKTISGKYIYNNGMGRYNKQFVYWMDFYNSERFKMHPNLKDIVAYSKLSNKQLNNINYSHNMAKIQVLRVMKDLGVQPDFRKKLVIQHEKREVYPLGKNKYNNLPNTIEMLYDIPNIKDKKKNKYLDYVERCINGYIDQSKTSSWNNSDSE
jgi:hypothetical protein